MKSLLSTSVKYFSNKIDKVKIGSVTTGIYSKVDLGRDDMFVEFDEPEAYKGTNKAPTPMEINLSCLIGCENIAMRLISQKLGIDIGEATYSVEGEYNLRDQTQPFWKKICFNLELETNASEKEIEKLKNAVERACPVNSMIESHPLIEVETKWNVVKPKGDI